MPIEINELEVSRFGITAARLTDPVASLDQVNEAARRHRVQMITARVDSSDLRRVQALEEDGYRLMDTLVYYERGLADLREPTPSPAGELIRRATPQDAAAVADVAHEAFKGYYGHYHADPRLSPEAADAAYTEWAELSIARTGEGTPALVVEHSGRLVAFLTTRLDVSEIVLNAVRPEAQGGGIYGRLIDRSLLILRDAGCGRAVVSTQINNIAVQRAWCNRGFRLARSLYTLHKWF
jgi:ribosomal protein S18 acetylase RimI-like enzyme